MTPHIPLVKWIENGRFSFITKRFIAQTYPTIIAGIDRTIMRSLSVLVIATMVSNAALNKKFGTPSNKFDITAEFKGGDAVVISRYGCLTE